MQAAQIREALDSATLVATRREGAEAAPAGAVHVVDADRLPDGKLVKLSDLERAEFEKAKLLDYSGKKAVMAALGLLGYKVAALPVYVGYKSLPVIDGLARGVDRLGNKLLSMSLKKLPWPLRPIMKSSADFMDKTAKWLGIDKSLLEHLKKHKEDRKKLAEKFLKEFRAEEVKQERKADTDAKKKKLKEERDHKRFVRLSEKYGAEVARIMVYEEMHEIEREEDDDAEGVEGTQGAAAA